MIVGAPSFHYEDGAAPFGEMDIALPHKDESMRRLPNVAAQAAGEVLWESWRLSDWLPEEAVTDNFSFDQRSSADLHHLGVHVARRAFSCEGHVLAYAINPASAAGSQGRRLEQTLSAQYVGFANGNPDVSGNIFARGLKRVFASEKIYSKGANVDVRPAFQGSGLGTALFYRVMAALPEDKLATTYVARSNRQLLASLGSIGFRRTGVHSRDDLVDGVVVDEVRLQGPPAGEVCETMGRRLPWLNRAIFYGGSAENL